MTKSSDNIIVIAVGGNALASEKGSSTLESQAQAAIQTSKYIVDAIESGFKVVLTHGNGPQVGYILRRSELAASEVPTVPMAYATADTEGAIGFMFQRAIYNELARRNIKQEVQTLINQVLVDSKDPAFATPNKPIGSYMDEAQAKELAQANHWHVMEDAGRGYRRCVASPKPQSVIEIGAIKKLLDENMIVIAIGGGGIPVVKASDNTLTAVDAVIDKDLSSCLLAKQLNAKAFVVATAVEKVAIHFGHPDEKWLSRISVAEALEYQAQGHFPAGSMGPKMAAAIDFVTTTKQSAIITNIENIANALAGIAGTAIVAE